MIIYGCDIGGDTAMNAKKFIIDDRRKWQIIEKIHDEVVDFLIVLDKT